MQKPTWFALALVPEDGPHLAALFVYCQFILWATRISLLYLTMTDPAGNTFH